MNRLKKLLKKNSIAVYTYRSIKSIFMDLYCCIYRQYFHYRNKKIIYRIKKQEKIKIAFLISSISQWKMDSVYKTLRENQKYELQVYVVNENANDPDVKKELSNTEEVLKLNNYNVVDAFSSDSKIKKGYQSIQKSDVVFLTRLPNWNRRLSIKKLTKSLTCYVPYSIHTDLNHYLQYGTPTHQCLTRHYVPFKQFQEFAETLYPAKNCIVVGYPGLDPFIDKKFILKERNFNIWYQKEKIKVIWAPHHSIEEGDNWPFFSTFIRYAKQMLEFALHSNEFEICFKPHPFLKQKLYDHDLWGKDETDKYYFKWARSDNCILNEFSYHHLFLTADAMILDSVSFMTEFLFLKKPMCFLTRHDKGDYVKYLNKVGIDIFNSIDKARSWSEIELFLNDLKKAENIIRNDNGVVRSEDRVSIHKNKTSADYIAEDLRKLLG